MEIRWTQLPHPVGEVVDLPKGDAVAQIEKGAAVPVQSQQKREKAVPKRSAQTEKRTSKREGR